MNNRKNECKACQEFKISTALSYTKKETPNVYKKQLEKCASTNLKV